MVQIFDFKKRDLYCYYRLLKTRPVIKLTIRIKYIRSEVLLGYGICNDNNGTISFFCQDHNVPDGVLVFYSVPTSVLNSEVSD